MESPGCRPVGHFEFPPRAVLALVTQLCQVPKKPRGRLTDSRRMEGGVDGGKFSMSSAISLLLRKTFLSPETLIQNENSSFIVASNATFCQKSKGNHTGRGRRCTVNSKIIKKRLSTKFKVSLIKFDCETSISKFSAYRIAKKELNPKAYKFQKVQLFTNENKHVWLERCSQFSIRPMVFFLEIRKEKTIGLMLN
ncbi:hypothetical protein LAZ67_X001475 [Cordylochernes scorpioides]|uniref:Uncharacterized protein n=1 Tax=Cordylochernes scorpioides TaxID=51811 RepID=A0ABY6LSX2_9ARAC|nr:hypothetical protein LAZ67_X001475 [Cordylochernes scorpioides]